MRYTLEVTSRAHPGRDAEFARWYAEIHVKEVLALPGFIDCARYRRQDAEGTQGDFVALYTVETDDPPALLQSLFAAAPNMQMTDAIDPKSVGFAFLRPLA